MGRPGEVVFEELTDWARNADDRIRYYSGTAVYKKTITLDKLDKDEELVLRIPQLGAMAQVFINGKEVSTIWCSPWEADLTPYVQEGDNALELRVVNSLTNRMIGDVSLPQEERYTYAYRNSESGRQAGSFGHHRRSFIGKEIVHRSLYVESFIYSRS